MTSPPKTSQGDPFRNLDSLLDWIENGAWVYWNSRPKHPGVILSLPLRTVLIEVNKERFYRCYRFGKTPKGALYLGEPYQTGERAS